MRLRFATRAQLGDADRIGAIQVCAWQVAYRGVMPDAYLEELDVRDRAAFMASSGAEGLSAFGGEAVQSSTSASMSLSSL